VTEGGESASGAAGEAVVHASAVAVAGHGVLILGPSGAGKSALALELIAGGGVLIADDRVRLRREGAGLVASAPPAIAGLIEARSFGLLRVSAVAEARLLVAVDLGAAPAARLPHWGKFALLGAEVDLISGRGLPNLGTILKVFAESGGATA
jgi:HPr kinase/phosphorylase